MTGDGDPGPEVSALEVEDLHVHYSVRQGAFGRKAAVRAVDGVSLTVQQGETLGLVGESGCGKSTLSRALILLESPQRGEVRLNGEPIGDVDRMRLRREIQMIFQDPYESLPPHMSVRSIIEDPLLIHRLAAGDELRGRVDRLLADVGLPLSVADKRPGQLSGGQRQRVSIARALSVEPSILIADEAVSALDVSVQAQILNLLKELQSRYGLSMLFVSHDIGVVSYLSHRVAVMYLGKTVEIGDARQVINEPQHPYTRALMAAVPGLHRRRREKVEVVGSPPDPKNPPSGCPFHPRCPWAQDICRAELPDLRPTVSGQVAACHFVDEDTELSAPDQARRPA
jgi:oligopeptide/dipeptide ABC transporter ATP-binding protein